MKRAKKITVLFTTIALSLSAGIVLAEDRQPSATKQAGEIVERTSGTATVEKVDKQNRKLTLRDREGKQFTMTVPEQVTRFDAIQQGDQLDVDYYESVALSLKKGAKGAAPTVRETELVGREAGKLPAGMAAHKITATAEVTGVDRENNQLTIRGPRGATHTIHITDPQLQQQLGQVKQGDMIQVSYTEAIVAEIKRPQQQGQREQGMEPEPQGPREQPMQPPQG